MKEKLAHKMAVRFSVPYLSGRMSPKAIQDAVQADCIDEEHCSPELAVEISQLAMQEMDRKLTFARLQDRMTTRRSKAVA